MSALHHIVDRLYYWSAMAIPTFAFVRGWGWAMGYVMNARFYFEAVEDDNYEVQGWPWRWRILRYKTEEGWRPWRDWEQKA